MNIFSTLPSPHQANSLTTLTERLPTIAITIAISAAILAVAFFTYTAIRRKLIRKNGSLPEPVLRHWRASLIEQVKEATQSQGMRISLRIFWRGTGLTNANRYVILEPLLERQVLYRAYSTDPVVSFFQRLRWDFLNYPVGSVRLSEKSWIQLASGERPEMVANGDIIVITNSPGAGVQKSSPNAKQTINFEVSPALAAQLADALREDARAIAQQHPVRERAESLADRLEQDSRARRPSSTMQTVQEILAFTSDGAGLWAATLAILAASGLS